MAFANGVFNCVYNGTCQWHFPMAFTMAFTPKQRPSDNGAKASCKPQCEAKGENHDPGAVKKGKVYGARGKRQSTEQRGKIRAKVTWKAQGKWGQKCAGLTQSNVDN